MERIFWVSCPSCRFRYSVDHALRRRADVTLECPRCRDRFPVESAASIED
ncbi:zinc-ribbon domain-containing protein [Streptomyces sp. DSM 44917]|uniref:Zinc-ribbon domain-containing protein n=1 Tax=Streptomyces boetiae TaxID=3075541 RepID=A0ABU2L4L6_9ACTN|nr:zinc-ribbon domain-containing protein [Streptomyces sp. DSM 44917]MDT0306462.1 zinc-ribbon domain-containing protein [Streptomyces sp. DSM 44917]